MRDEKQKDPALFILEQDSSLLISIRMVVFPKFANDKWQFYDHFWPFFANYMDIFHKTDVQTVTNIK